LAAKYGGFGAGSPEVLDPAEAEVDKDVLGSGAVQKALVKVQGYQGSVRSMQTNLVNDKQANVKPVIIKELDFGDLRSTLNTVNTAFDEDTQRGTDRLIRAIIQDITELEIANKQKDGIPRSDRRVDTMNAKLAKLDKAFEDLLAFAK
jgi:Fe-S-cluster formation regulator IscX/YfhJ